MAGPSGVSSCRGAAQVSEDQQDTAASCSCDDGSRPVSSGTLYVVATPLGNLEDVTLRALRILREVSLVACEDTRRTATLLSAHGIRTPTTSYFEHNERWKGERILAALRDGKRRGSRLRCRDAGSLGPRLSPRSRCPSVRAVLWSRCPAPARPSRRFRFRAFPRTDSSSSASCPRGPWPGNGPWRLSHSRTETLVFYESPQRILSVPRRHGEGTW